MPRRLPILLLCAAAHAAFAGAGDDAGTTDPFSVWDGVTQLFPARRGTENHSHAEFAEAAVVESHAEFAEAVSHAESAEFAEFVGEFVLPDDAPEGLSGIAWHGGIPGFNGLYDNLYGLVEDSGGRLHSATIDINRRTGEITNAVVRPVRSPVPRIWKASTAAA